MNYAIRRIFLMFPTLLLASFLIAGMIFLLPGDVIDIMTQGAIRGEDREFAEKKLGLDKPFLCMGIKCFWTESQYIRWVLGAPETEAQVYQTTTGGERWRQLGSDTVEPLSSSHFIDDKRGWAIGKNIIFGTADGGRVWQNQHKSDRTVNALDFGDEDNVWAVGDKGMILHSDQGGSRRFEAQKTLTSWFDQATGTSQKLTDVDFIDPDQGWVVGNKGIILYTSDAGELWIPQGSSTDADLKGIAFNADGTSGVAVGDNGTILWTSDSGSSWTPVASNTGTSFNDVTFSDSSTVWAVGSGGTVSKSSNGGVTWSTGTATYIQDGVVGGTTDANLNSIQFGTSNEGIAAGDGGLVLYTEDGGASWIKRDIIIIKGGRGGEEEIIGPIGDPVRDVSIGLSSSGSARAWVTTENKYWRWGALGGNLGETFVDRVPVTGRILDALGPSVELLVLSSVFAILSFPIGIISAIRQDSWGDYAGRIVAILGVSVPTFYIASMVLVFPSLWWAWAPPLRYQFFFDAPIENLKFFAIPAVLSGFPRMASIMRMTRTQMLEVMRQDYVRTAWSKGLRERVVVVRHGMKNAMLPVITILGLQLLWALGGQIIVEQIFAIPGIGRLGLEALVSRDFPLIQGVTMFFGVLTVFIMLATDLSYAWLNPRIRYE